MLMYRFYLVDSDASMMMFSFSWLNFGFETSLLLPASYIAGVAVGYYMCDCIVAFVSTQAITLLVHSKVNTSDCKKGFAA